MVESWEPLADANGPYDGRAVVVKMRANLLKESGGGAQRERRGWEVLLGGVERRTGRLSCGQLQMGGLLRAVYALLWPSKP